MPSQQPLEEQHEASPGFLLTFSCFCTAEGIGAKEQLLFSMAIPSRAQCPVEQVGCAHTEPKSSLLARW